MSGAAKSNVLMFLAAMCAVGTVWLAVVAVTGPNLVYAVMAVLLAVAVLAHPIARERRWLLPALLFSAAGDFLLAIPWWPPSFVGGLSAFLLAHLCFLGALLPLAAPTRPRVVLGAVVVAACVGLLVWFWPHLAADGLTIPVTVYMLVLAAMVGSALLARLQHPGIAQIHEAGSANLFGDTLPFFAMELVEGEPLDKICGEVDRPAAALVRDLGLDGGEERALLVVVARLARIGERATGAVRVELQVLHARAGDGLALAATVGRKDHAGRGAATTAAAARERLLRVAVATAAALTAAEELHAVDDDLRHVPLVAVLVVPRAGLELALDVHGAALVEVLRAVLRGLPPHDEAVPLRLLLLLARLVGPPLVRREAHLAHGLAGVRVLQLGLGTEVPDQDHLVDAGHASLSGAPSTVAPRAGPLARRGLPLHRACRGLARLRQLRAQPSDGAGLGGEPLQRFVPLALELDGHRARGLALPLGRHPECLKRLLGLLRAAALFVERGDVRRRVDPAREPLPRVGRVQRALRRLDPVSEPADDAGDGRGPALLAPGRRRVDPAERHRDARDQEALGVVPRLQGRERLARLVALALE